MDIPDDALLAAYRAIEKPYTEDAGLMIIARAALEAVVPHIAKQAWEQGAKAQADAYGMDVDAGLNPYTGAA